MTGRATFGRPGRRLLGSVTGLAAGVALVGLTASPAAAVLTENGIGCSGSADITAGDGTTYHVDANDTEAKVPRSGTAAWRGAVATVTHDHKGEVSLEVGPFWDVQIGAWGPSANTANVSSAQGVTELPSALAEVPTGKYKLTGYHTGKEGGCAGEAVVEVEGGAFSNIAGISGIAGTVLFTALLALAARGKTGG